MKNGGRLGPYLLNRQSASIFTATLVLAPGLVARSTAPDLYNELKFRQTGPFRGGRVIAVAGVPSQPSVDYFGGTRGVCNTSGGGAHWGPITHGHQTGSVGALAVADSDPNDWKPFPAFSPSVRLAVVVGQIEGSR